MLKRLFTRFATSQTLLFSVLAVIVGLFSGIGVWLFKVLFALLNKELFGLSDSIANWTVFLIPILGGLAVGLLSKFFIGREKLHGTASVMQSVALSGGRLRYQKTPIKTLAAILSLGSGASVGPEDPSVFIGASIGSLFGQKFRVSEERLRSLVASGAAAAIAAAFNAPIAGVFFALEIVLGELAGSSMGMILVSSVTSAVFTQAVSGSQPAFTIPHYGFNSAWELPLYLLLGLLAGPVSAFYVRLLYKMQDLFGSWNAPAWIKPAAAGLGVGLVGLFLPQIFGDGYEIIGSILNNDTFSIWMLLLLLIAKLILTPLSIGGGFYGGVFAPSLFLGATLGAAFGIATSQFLPALNIQPAAFALVGMAAVLAGAVHAPLTASLLLFEMTADYRIILPLLFSVAFSMVISQRIQRDSVYSMGLARHGIRLARGKDIEVLATISVGEVMRANPDTLTEPMTLKQASDELARTRRQGMAVVDGRGDLAGMLTLQDIDRALEQNRTTATVGDVCTRNLTTTTPQESLADALQRMSQGDLGRLPVVAADNPRELVGILRRVDVIHAYSMALSRRTTQRFREQSVRLDAYTPEGVDVTEILVESSSVVDGKRMSEIQFPSECVIASVQRGRKVLIPHGSTRLQGGDVLIAVVGGAARDEVLHLCQKEDTSK